MTYRHRHITPRADHSTDALARGLGWFSIALGVAEIIAPRMLTRSLGMEDQAQLVRAYGLREAATGIAILSQDDRALWVWGRVAGDVLDLATLSPGLTRDNPANGRVGLAMATVAAVTVLDVFCATALTSEEGAATRVRHYSG